jgi:hypothetical protein
MIKQLIEDEVRKMLTGETDEHVQPTMRGSKFKIVIAQRGFVFAGECYEYGDYIVLHNAVNIRRWGTTKGLGELAEKGNLTNTKADGAGVVRLHKLAVVAMLDCKGEINATT